MSDTPQGGWWKAKDGKWYPPETHPDHSTVQATEVPAGPPAAGWWQANDGNWYPPETHPDRTASADATIDLTDASAGTAAVEDDSTAWSTGVGGATAGVAGAEVGRDESGTWDLTPGSTVDTAEPESTPPAEPVVESFVDTQVPEPTTVPEPTVTPEPTAPADLPSFAAPSTDQSAGTRPSLFNAAPLPTNGSPVNGNGNGNGTAAWGAPTTDPVDLPSGSGDDATFGDAAPEAATDVAVEPPVQAPPAAPQPAQFNLGHVVDLTPPAPTVAAPSAAPSVSTDDDGDAPLPGWRKGADGAWYPPDQEPPTRASVFPSSNRTSTLPSSSPTPSSPKSTSSRSKLPWIIVGVAAALVLAVVAAVLVLGGGDDADEGTDLAADATSTTAPATTAPPTTLAGPPPAQASGETSGTVDLGANVTDQYLALITHDGAGPFSVSLLGADGQVSQELVAGASGQYLGVVLVNPEEAQAFRSVRADASGPWAVTFAVVQSAPPLPGTPGSIYDGTGDEVLSVDLDGPATVRFTCAVCDGPAQVTGYGAGLRTASQSVDGSGELVIPAATTQLQVVVPSSGSPVDWSLTVS